MGRTSDNFNHIDTHDKSPITSKWETQRSRLRRGDWWRSAESYSLLRDLLRESWLLSLRLSTTSVLSSTDHQQTPRPPFHANRSLCPRSSQHHSSSRSSQELPEPVLSRRNGRRLVLRQSGRRARGPRSEARRNAERLLRTSRDSRS